MRADLLLPLLVVSLCAATLAQPHVSAMSSGAVPVLDCRQCHTDAGEAELAVEGLPEAYEAGKAYVLTIRIVKGPEPTGDVKGGFAIAASAGELRPADPALAQAVTIEGEQAVTQTEDGARAREWRVVWVAPESGEVRIKVAVIAANGDYSPLGDAYAYEELVIGPAERVEEVEVTPTSPTATPTPPEEATPATPTEATPPAPATPPAETPTESPTPPAPTEQPSTKPQPEKPKPGMGWALPAAIAAALALVAALAFLLRRR